MKKKGYKSKREREKKKRKEEWKGGRKRRKEGDMKKGEKRGSNTVYVVIHRCYSVTVSTEI